MARKSRKNTETSLLSQKPAMKVWRTGLYVWLSVEDNGNRGDSLETQRQIIPIQSILDGLAQSGVSGQYLCNCHISLPHKL